MQENTQVEAINWQQEYKRLRVVAQDMADAYFVHAGVCARHQDCLVPILPDSPLQRLDDVLHDVDEKVKIHNKATRI